MTTGKRILLALFAASMLRELVWDVIGKVL